MILSLEHHIVLGKSIPIAYIQPFGQAVEFGREWWSIGDPAVGGTMESNTSYQFVRRLGWAHLIGD